ncbi:Rhomboid family protein [Corynebacterium pseudotuberculosis 267]|uniref:rhomboid family intramembrane serine protease n=1 Tax=Corynebacterium pseudotuberculosis TaxID=1719 RepID=UPI0002593D70|nr:rhomboid family intramembrane serine protease [Corynebacterium pseudotuberculosis]AFH52609.1 Rhomboid family protein [Corynebacterium pseudotuberculosis 267]
MSLRYFFTRLCFIMTNRFNPYAQSDKKTYGGVSTSGGYLPHEYGTQYLPTSDYPVNRAVQRGVKRTSLCSMGRKRLADATVLALGYVVVIWAVHIVNTVFFGGTLAQELGVHPLDGSSIWHIFTSPLVHGSYMHISANTLPGLIFVFLIGLSGRRPFWEVTMITAVVGGMGTWIFGGIGTTHIGAPGLIYGWLAYLVVRGIFNKSFSQVVLGVVLAFMYGGLIWGVLPGDVGVSWQAHLFGAIGGLIAGATITSDDPPALKARREQQALHRV